MVENRISTLCIICVYNVVDVFDQIYHIIDILNQNRCFDIDLNRFLFFMNYDSPARN